MKKGGKQWRGPEEHTPGGGTAAPTGAGAGRPTAAGGSPSQGPEKGGEARWTWPTRPWYR